MYTYICRYMYICMCVCMYAYIYIYIYIYIFLCTCIPIGVPDPPQRDVLRGEVREHEQPLPLLPQPGKTYHFDVSIIYYLPLLPQKIPLNYILLTAPSTAARYRY